MANNYASIGPQGFASQANVRGGGAGSGPSPSTGGGWGISSALQGAEDVLANPQTQMFLAQLGQGMSPEGSVGDALGGVTQNTLQRQALAEALAGGRGVKMGADGSMDIKPGETTQSLESPGMGAGGEAQNQNQGPSIKGLETKLFDSMFDEED